jgi:hypothetical protein
MTPDLDAARRFCAQWHAFFDSDTPPVLRLRPIVDPGHPLRAGDISDVLGTQRTFLDREVELVKARVGALPDVLPDFGKQINAQPEHMGFLVAASLYAKGHSPQYLVNLERAFAEALIEISNPLYVLDKDRNRILKAIAHGTDDLDLSSFGKETTFDVYFAYKKASKISAPAFSILSYDDLPPEIAERLGRTLSNIRDRKFLFKKAIALDANHAVRRCIGELAKRGRDPLRKTKSSNVDPFADLHDYVAIEKDDVVISFYWPYNRLHFRGFGVDAAIRSRVHSGPIDSPSLSQLRTKLGEAQNYIAEHNQRMAFRILIEGLDHLFAPIAQIYDVGRTERSSLLRNCAAAFLSFQSAHDILIHTHAEVMQQLEIPISELRSDSTLRQFLDERLPDSFRKYRALGPATLIDKFSGSLTAMKEHLNSAFARFFLDMNHIIVMRNKVIHSEEVTIDEYYVTLLVFLFAGLIQFRAHSALLVTDIQECHATIIPAKLTGADGAFFVFMQLMMEDARYVNSGTAPIWLRTSTLTALHFWGWGSWMVGGLRRLIVTDNMVTVEKSLAEGLRSKGKSNLLTPVFRPSTKIL